MKIISLLVPLLLLTGCVSGKLEEGTKIFEAESLKCEHTQKYKTELDCKVQLLHQNISPYLGAISKQEIETIITESKIDAIHVEQEKISKEEARLLMSKRLSEFKTRDTARKWEAVNDSLDDIPPIQPRQITITNCSSIGSSLNCTSF